MKMTKYESTVAGWAILGLYCTRVPSSVGLLSSKGRKRAATSTNRPVSATVPQ